MHNFYVSNCLDIDECKVKNVCEQNCENKEGTFSCSCKEGYQLTNGTKCRDIDECLDNTCHQCKNWPGGFMCSCRDGFRVNSTTHRDCESRHCFYDCRLMLKRFFKKDKLFGEYFSLSSPNK